MIKARLLSIVAGLILLLQNCAKDPSVEPQITSEGTIETVVGNGVFDHTGDGGPSGAASLGYVTDVALDASGNVYLTDGAANVVRKSVSGSIETIAGTFLGFNVIDPTPFHGDGGPATEAHFNVPLGLTVAASGNVYIVDGANSVIRKIDASTGVITTVAGIPSAIGYSGDGGPATSAELWDPYDIAVDVDENIYIADADNNVIRKVTASTGIITTIAGIQEDGPGYQGDGGPATDALLHRPKGIAVDLAGNIYIADAGNNVIRKISASTGIITTVAGSGPLNEGYDGDGGVAIFAKLAFPPRVAVDLSGNLYIADAGNNAIRKVTASTGIITTLAGTGTSGYTGDGGPATSASLSSPQGVAVDGSGNVYIADNGNSVIRKVKQ